MMALLNSALFLTIGFTIGVLISLPQKQFQYSGTTQKRPFTFSEKEKSKRNSTLYGKYCNTTIVGEKQPWNTNKKIISFAVFASAGETNILQWVKDGLEIQANTAKQFYPDWVVRFYAAGLAYESQLELIQHDNVEVVQCSRLKSSSRMMILRFLAVDDPAVMFTLVRDVDSRFTLRELMAVNEWLAAPTGQYDFHSMRDHAYHGVAVMGGCFGMKRGLFDENNTTMTALVEKAMQENPGVIRGAPGEDQAFLANYVWPLVKDRTLDHDINQLRCKQYGAKTCHDFPLGPRNESEHFYVGAAFKQKTRFTSNTTGHTCTVHCKVD